MKKRSQRLVMFLVMILVIPSITCTVLNPKSDPPQRQPGGESPDGVQPEEQNADLLETTGEEIEIIQTTAYLDEFGNWNIHGLMTNAADYTVGSIELEIKLADGSTAEPLFVGAYGIAPGEILPFDSRLPVSVTNVDEYEINILQSQRIAKEPLQLEIGQTSLKTAENGIVTLVGEVQNNTNSPALIQSIKAGLFSADGELITTASCQVCSHYLDPGDSGPFQFLIFGQPADTVIDHFEVYLSSEIASEIEGLDLSFLEPIHSYIDGGGQIHVLGEVQNLGEKILDIQLLATYYDQSGQIVGAASYNLPLNSLLPGEISPYDLVLNNPLTEVADWKIQVDTGRSRTVDSPSFVLASAGHETTVTEYQWTFSGNVTNDTDETLKMVLVVIGIKEAGTGKVAGLTQRLIAGEFPPGASIEYNLAMSLDTEFNQAILEEFIIVRGR